MGNPHSGDSEKGISSSVDYDTFMKEHKTGNSSLDSYIGYVFNERKRLDSHYLEDLKSRNKKVDDFLKKHSNLSYSEFFERSKPDEIQGNSYGLIKRKSIKRDIFDIRAKLYIGALYDYEQNGGNLDEILDLIRKSEVPFVKKAKEKEPTFEALYRLLKQK